MLRQARGAADGRHLKNLAAHAVRSPAYGPNVVADSDAEKVGTADWTLYNGVVATKEAGAPSGAGVQVLRLTFGGLSNPAAEQSIFTTGKMYELETWIRSSSTGTPGSVTRGSARVIDQPKNVTWGKSKHWYYADGATLHLRPYSNVSWAEFDETIARIYTAAAISGLSVSHAAVEVALISALGLVPIDYDAICHCEDGILVHHASSQRVRTSCTTINAGSIPWTITNATVELGQSAALAQPVALFKETVTNAEHYVQGGTVLSCAVTGSHVLTFFAAGLGRSLLRVRIGLAAGDVTQDFTLTSSLERYSMSFTATAGDIGVNKSIRFNIMSAPGVVSYAGDTSKGVYVDMVQAEAGDIPTPYQRSYGAAVSGIAPVYNHNDPWLLWRASGRSIDAEYRCRWLYALPAAVTAAPLWALGTGGSSPKWVKLEYRTGGGGSFAIMWDIGTGWQEVTTPTGWVPVAGREYEFRLHFCGDSATLRIIDYTGNTVTDYDSTTYRGASPWVFETNFTIWYLGCDQSQINQWNHAIQGVAA